MRGHDQQTKWQEVGESPGLWRPRRTACQDRELLVPTRSRFKFSFLIRRWGNQVQTLFLLPPPQVKSVFSMRHVVQVLPPSHFAVLLLTSRDTCSPFRGLGSQVRPVCLPQEGFYSSAESKNMVSITPDLNAVHGHRDVAGSCFRS